MTYRDKIAFYWLALAVVLSHSTIPLFAAIAPIFLLPAILLFTEDKK